MVEIAKREWLQSWIDFDDVLQRMWSTNQSTRSICLKIITNLVEDVFLNEDPVAGLRSPLLSAGLISIMASTEIVKSYYASNPLSLVHGIDMKPGSSGWLRKFSQELSDNNGGDQVLSILNALRATLGWMITKSIVDAQIMQRVCSALMHSSVAVQICAVDCLYILLTRPLNPQDDLLPDIYSLYQPEAINALSHVWQSAASTLSFEDGMLNNEEMYTMLKKLSETIIALACFKFGFTVKQKVEEIELATILDLVLLTWRHKSLIISSMANSFWCSLVRDERLNSHPHVSDRYVQMLQVASQRLLRFEDAKLQMLQGSELQMYLDLDIENTPELHAFCGNYRRFMYDIVRMVVFKRPVEATQWAREQVANFFAREYAETAGSDFASKSSTMYLNVEAKFCLIEACLRGILRYKERLSLAEISDDIPPEAVEPAGPSARLSNEQATQMNEELRQAEEIVTDWCSQLLDMQFHDPLMLGRHVSVLVAFSTFLQNRSDLLFKILEKVIQTATHAYPNDDNQESSDPTTANIRDLRGRCGTELIRIGSTLPDQLWGIYPQLESTVENILSRPTASESEHTTFNALLLAVSQRSTNTNEQQKAQEFGKVVAKLCNLWDSGDVTSGLGSFENFVKILMVDRIAEYFKMRNIAASQQLDSHLLDPSGVALLKSMKEARNWFWPIRASRRFVEATMDTPSALREFEKHLWKEPITRIVPNILRLLSAIGMFYNPSNWQSLPFEMQLLARESVLERFWLHGVSQVSRDEFLEASAKASDTCRELAHSVGHFLRRTREYCLASIGTFSSIGDNFYAIPNIGKDCMQALYGDTSGTSLHVWSTTITSCLRNLILNCPQSAYDTVLSELMSTFPKIILGKLQADWGRLMERGALQSKNEEDQDQMGKEDFSDEMMEESLLRHLSYATVKLMSDVLTPPITTLRVERAGPGMGRSQMSDWLLRQKSMVGGIMLLLSFCLTVNDTRTAIHAAKILRAIIPFLMETEDFQRYVCHEVFSATIRCIHDPYFVSIQGDLINLLAHIYYLSLGQSTLPRDILLSIPQMSRDVGVIKKFEDKLADAKSDRSRRSLMHELLVTHEIVGREGYGRGSTVRVKLGADVTTKEVIKRFQESVSLQQSGGSGIDERDVLTKDEDSGIGSLFH